MVYLFALALFAVGGIALLKGKAALKAVGSVLVVLSLVTTVMAVAARLTNGEAGLLDLVVGTTLISAFFIGGMYVDRFTTRFNREVVNHQQT